MTGQRFLKEVVMFELLKEVLSAGRDVESVHLNIHFILKN